MARGYYCCGAKAGCEMRVLIAVAAYSTSWPPHLSGRGELHVSSLALCFLSRTWIIACRNGPVIWYWNEHLHLLCNAEFNKREPMSGISILISEPAEFLLGAFITTLIFCHKVRCFMQEMKLHGMSTYLMAPRKWDNVKANFQTIRFCL